MSRTSAGGMAVGPPAANDSAAASYVFPSSGLSDHQVEDRWRELFPVPPAPVPDRTPGLSTSSGRRRAKVRSLVLESNQVIDSLNEMFAPHVKNTEEQPSMAHRACHHSIFQQLARLPTSSSTCTMREAVQELLQCDASYGQEDFSSTVRPYSRPLVSLPETGDEPIPLTQVLDPLGIDYVGNPARHMMLSEEEWGEVLEKGDIVKPYMDEILQHDRSQYGGFIKDLYGKGMFTFTSKPQEIVPPFFVRKKSGKLRLILDCRAVNRRFKRPPPLALGAGTSWAQVSVPQGCNLHLAQSDIKDYFYSLQLPPELQPLFCLPALPLSLVQDWGFPELQRLEGDSEGLIFPMLRVVPMGWSWAMWIAQRVHQHLCLEASGLDVDRIVVEGKPAPGLQDGEVILIPYADNLNVAGIDQKRVQEVKDKIVAHLRQVGFRVHEELEACSIGQSLGFLIDGARGIVSPVPERLQKVRLALLWMSRQPRVTGKQVERLLGHCIHLMLLRRELLSIFRNLYDFVQSSYTTRQRLFASAAREAKWASHLLGLCTVDLRRDWSSIVTASDASLSGIAVCRSEWDMGDVVRTGGQKEPWRYKYKTVVAPRDAALTERPDPFTDPCTVKPLNVPREDPFDLNEDFQEIPSDLLEPSLWHEAFAVHMQYPEHITLLEGRGIVAAMRHKLRSCSEFGKKHLHLNDNMGAVLMCSKGRSGSFPMLKICRRLCALLLCSDAALVTRWIPSEVNIADGPSRRWESLRKDHAPGRAEDKWLKTQVDGRCYPTRAGRCDFGQALFRTSAQQEQEVCEERCFLRDSGGEVKAESGEDSSPTGSTSFQRSDHSGKDGCLRAMCPGLSQTDQGLETVCESQQAVLKGCDEIRRGLLLVSEQHLRARRRPTRRHKVLGSNFGCFPRLRPQEPVGAYQASFAGLVKDRPSEDQTAHTLGVDSCNGDEDVRKEEISCRIGRAHHVHSLSSSKRVSGSDEGRLSATHATAETFLSAPSSIKSTRGFKSGALRRKFTSGFSTGPMAGGVSCQHENRRSISFRPQLHRVGSDMEAGVGGHETAPTTCSTLPTSTCRTFARPLLPTEVSCRDQGKRPLGLRHQSEAIRSSWTNQPGVSSSPFSNSEACHSVRKTFGEDGPKIFCPKEEIKFQGFVIELFSGCARLSESAAAHGYVAIAFDIDYGAGCDLLAKRVRFKLRKFISTFHSFIKMIWLGTPCTSWSRARRLDGGPKPLRDDDVNLFGFPNLSQADQQRVKDGNSFLDVSKFFVDLAERYSLRWVIENPFTSRIWLTPHVRALQDLGAVLYELHFCAFGTPWRKATGLLSNFSQLATITRICHPCSGRCEFTGKKHIVLSGKDKSGVWLTLRAQPYPFALCNQISSCLFQADFPVH